LPSTIEGRAASSGYRVVSSAVVVSVSRRYSILLVVTLLRLATLMLARYAAASNIAVGRPRSIIYPPSRRSCRTVGHIGFRRSRLCPGAASNRSIDRPVATRFCAPIATAPCDALSPFLPFAPSHNLISKTT